MTADGKFSWLGLQHLAIKNRARDGENLAKLVYGREFNDSGIAVQLLDNDKLDDQMRQRLDNGSEIRMGVEVNGYGRPTAFHVFNGHPQRPAQRSKSSLEKKGSAFPLRKRFEKEPQGCALQFEASDSALEFFYKRSRD